MFTGLANYDDRVRLAVELNAEEAGNIEELPSEGSDLSQVYMV